MASDPREVAHPPGAAQTGPRGRMTDPSSPQGYAVRVCREYGEPHGVEAGCMCDCVGGYDLVEYVPAAERDEALAEAERLREALRKIDTLSRKWGAPLCHEPGDMGSAAWAAVGSEADLIAHRALGGSLRSARARLMGGAR